MMTRAVLVTGVSRRVGIAWTIAEQLHREGWEVTATGWPPHDAEQPWGADPAAPSLAGIAWQPADLADPEVPDGLVADCATRRGRLDALVVVHARSSSGGIGELTAVELDRSFAVNARATLLLIQAAARADVRRVVVFTTGVHREPMPAEIAYAVSKAAIQGITQTLAAALAPRGITVNCINPGPNDTGYANDEARAAVAALNPGGRWSTPTDTARLAAWLLSDEADWITGQTIASDGGWSGR
jgi:3-oxoacyl-[acyl-carrier protein] reductase